MADNSDWVSKVPLVIAHRGASAYAPENTMAAFQWAVEAGADAIELDAKLSKDKIIVIMHDDTIDRTTDGVGNVKDKNFDELEGYDAGSQFSNEFSLERIPTLQAVLERFGHSILLNVELTNYASMWDDLPERVIQLVSENDLKDRVLLSSFNPIALFKCSRIDPQIQTALLIHGREPKWIQLFLRTVLRYDFFHPHEELIDRDLIRKMNRINAWTVNERERMRELFEWRVSGIITDVPDIALRVRDGHVRKYNS